MKTEIGYFYMMKVSLLIEFVYVRKKSLSLLMGKNVQVVIDGEAYCDADETKN